MPGISTGPTVWGAPPEAPGTGLAATVYATRHLIASGRPRKGSGSLPDAILRSFLGSGGKVHVNSVVEKLIIEQNRVRAVQLQNGTILNRKNFALLYRPIIINNYVFLITKNNFLILMNLKNGAIIF